MEEKKYKKIWNQMDKDTKLDWLISIYNDDLESSFLDSPEFDEAFEKYTENQLQNLEEEKIKNIIEEIYPE